MKNNPLYKQVENRDHYFQVKIWQKLHEEKETHARDKSKERFHKGHMIYPMVNG
jgi:hypothetical protein